MRITDYATSKTLNDVSLTLTVEEAEELASYLERLLQHTELDRAYLSEFQGPVLARELTVQLDRTHLSPRCA